MRSIIVAALLLVAPATANDVWDGEGPLPDNTVPVQIVHTRYGALQIRENHPLPPDIAEKVLEGTCFDKLLARDDRLKPFRDGAVVYSELRQYSKEGEEIYLNGDRNLGHEPNGAIARIDAHSYGSARDPAFAVRFATSSCKNDHAPQILRFFSFKPLPDNSAPKPDPQPVLQPVFAVSANGVLRRVRLTRVEADEASDWRFFHNGTRDVILGQIECLTDYRPGLPLGATKIVYTTFTYDGVRWRYAIQEEPGVWKAGDPFPERSKFPEIQP